MMIADKPLKGANSNSRHKAGHEPETPKKKALDKKLDEGLEETFPASDPVAVTNTTTPGSPDKPPRAAGKTNQRPPKER